LRTRSRSPSPDPDPSANEPHLIRELITPGSIVEEKKMPLKLADTKNEKAYGSDLLPGEGSAIAKYAAAGVRIPRRGEIGLETETIQRFEQSGYVMSGNRHAVMNAVRLRKENQVLTVEGRRRLALEAIEEKKKREEEIVKNFRNLINERLRKGDS
jgi:hypothetical protein